MLISAKIKKLRGKALIDEHSRPLVKINNAEKKAVYIRPAGVFEQIMLNLAPFFKGATINQKNHLDHKSLKRSETDFLKCHEYNPARIKPPKPNCSSCSFK